MAEPMDLALSEAAAAALADFIPQSSLVEARDAVDRPVDSATSMEVDSGAPDADEARWEEIFQHLQEAGQGDRGAHYALTISTLKRKGEEVQRQIDALQLAESNLLKAAGDEADQSLAKLQRRPSGQRAWGAALTSAVAQQAREASQQAALEEPPYSATQLAKEAQEQVAETLEAHSKAQAEAQAQAVAQAQQALMMQAEAVAHAQAVAEAQAQALSEAQAQAQAVAEMQAQLQAEANQAEAAQAATQAQAAEIKLLRAQGLNSKKLPLRPGVPPCSYFMRKGECKYGKGCKWDHPEASMNRSGYPQRPGETPCAFYLRTGACKFGATCKFDHPEALNPMLHSGAAANALAAQGLAPAAPAPGGDVTQTIQALAQTLAPAAPGAGGDVAQTIQALAEAAAAALQQQLQEQIHQGGLDLGANLDLKNLDLSALQNVDLAGLQAALQAQQESLGAEVAAAAAGLPAGLPTVMP